MIFNMSTSYFHKFSFDHFEDYLMTKLTLRSSHLLDAFWYLHLSLDILQYQSLQLLQSPHSLRYTIQITYTYIKPCQ